MDSAKKDRLAAADWRAGDADEFLDLTAEEAALIEMRLALADYFRDVRAQRGLTQSQAARKLGSSQSSIAQMESADATISLDLLIKSLLALGASRDDIGAVIARTG